MIHSELLEEDLVEYFGEFDVYAVPEDLNNMLPYQRDFIDFQALNGAESGKGYFVISNYYNAFSQNDLRGH